MENLMKIEKVESGKIYTEYDHVVDGFLDLFEGEHEQDMSERINALLTDVYKYYKWK